MNHNELNLFGIPVQTSFCPFFEEIKDNIASEILSLSEQQINDIESNVAPYLKSNLKESNFNLHEQNNELLNKLFNWIKEEIEYLNFKLSQNSLQCDIIESWYHVTSYGGYHGMHTHTNCSWCAIFCVDPGESDSGFNTFQSRESVGHIDPGYFWWSDIIKIPTEPGKLILFPSMLLHSADPYLGKEKKRIVISCNTKMSFRN
jgi:hypothetical protein